MPRWAGEPRLPACCVAVAVYSGQVGAAAATWSVCGVGGWGLSPLVGCAGATISPPRCNRHRYETTKAADAVAALKASLKPLATVKRDDKWQQIDAALLVPGDMVLLAAGAAVPADCVVSGVGWWRVRSQRPGRSKAGAAALLLAGGAAGAAQRVPSPACACWPSRLSE